LVNETSGKKDTGMEKESDQTSQSFSHLLLVGIGNARGRRNNLISFKHLRTAKKKIKGGRVRHQLTVPEGGDFKKCKGGDSHKNEAPVKNERRKKGEGGQTYQGGVSMRGGKEDWVKTLIKLKSLSI